MTPEERERRAGEAKRLLSEPLLNEAFDAIEKAAIEAVLTAETDEARRVHADRANTIRAVRVELQTIIDVGNQAIRQKPGIA